MMYTDINEKDKNINMNTKIKKCIVSACVIGSICLIDGCGETVQNVTAVVQENITEQEEEIGEQEVTTQQTSIVQEEATTEYTELVEADESDTQEETSQEETNEAETAEILQTVERRERVKVKGIYVSGPIAGNAKMDELIELVDNTELNAMVIDIKNDEGRITYHMDSHTVSEIGADVNYIQDIEGLVAKCKEKDIYLIARIVAFKDPYLAEQCPELAVKTKTGEVFHDKSGLAWVNPYNREVWSYLVEVGTQAAQVGFDEIQFDYIRFSTDLKSDKLDFGPESENKSKTEIITEFTQYVYERLSALGVYVAADVYGTIIDSKIDQDIVGQDYVAMASHLDYICPMVYPSHYANGVYGIPIPDAQPYDTVKAAMDAATKELEALPEEKRAINRVWIQSFTASWVDGHISYGPEQIRAQMHGAYDAGYDEWILWNAAVSYQKKSLLTEEEAQAEQMERDEANKQEK